LSNDLKIYIHNVFSQKFCKICKPSSRHGLDRDRVDIDIFTKFVSTLHCHIGNWYPIFLTKSATTLTQIEWFYKNVWLLFRIPFFKSI
jgi:hypothetical protein